MNDATLEHAVTEELEWAPHVDASQVVVAVRKGTVFLSGHVQTLAEKVRTEQAAWHVRGIRGVANEIEVRRPPAHRFSDLELERRARAILDWDAQIPDARVKLDVRAGVVYLKGDVEWQFQREEAEARVRQLAGIIGVINEIHVRPVKEASAHIRDNVLRALTRHRELDSSGISVVAEGPTITLSGHIPSPIQRQIAENAAWAAPGVAKVDNHLSLAP